MKPEIIAYIENLSQPALTEDRKQLLNDLAAYVKANQAPKLHFICTHNSRRSHLSQIWAQTFADYYGVDIQTYSGGTEATAFHPNAVGAIERAGFKVTKEGEDNPRYQITHTEGATPMTCYSKRYDEAPNPTSDFAAIMTCSEADSECPVVFGADKRIKLFYIDPKVSDGTPEEKATYDERCAQIAAEMKYVFGQLK